MFRPRCWSGKKRTLSPRASAHSRTARAFDDVHTAPPCSPTNAFSAADEFMYVIGHDAFDVGDAGDLLPALLDLVESAMSAIEQPGVEVGEDDSLVVAGEHVGRLGHEVHAAEDDVGGAVVVGRETGELERVADGRRPTDDFVALVVMAEDEQLRAERGLGGADPLRRSPRSTRGCSGPAGGPGVAT